MLDRNKTLTKHGGYWYVWGWENNLHVQKILRYAIQDYQIYIIDPENEYTKIVEATRWSKSYI